MVLARHRRGRHARAVRGVPGLLAPVAASRRAQVALGGAVALGLVMTAGLVAVGSDSAPRAAAVNVPARQRPPLPVAVTPAESSRGTGDEAALTYFRAKDPANAAHVDEIVWTGPMLRVYTDMPGSDADSKPAVALCETAAAYLTGRGQNPVVFVHADKQSGYPVLANKMNTKDDCRLNSVP